MLDAESRTVRLAPEPAIRISRSQPALPMLGPFAEPFPSFTHEIAMPARDVVQLPGRQPTGRLGWMVEIFMKGGDVHWLEVGGRKSSVAWASAHASNDPRGLKPTLLLP